MRVCLKNVCVYTDLQVQDGARVLRPEVVPDSALFIVSDANGLGGVRDAAVALDHPHVEDILCVYCVCVNVCV